MLFTSVHVTPHVTPHVSTPHVTTHVTEPRTNRVPVRSNNETKTPVTSNFANNTNMSRSGYETNGIWRNMFIFQMFNNANSHSYTLRIKDDKGHLHTVHLTRVQYRKVTKANKVIWKNGHVYADGHMVN